VNHLLARKAGFQMDMSLIDAGVMGSWRVHPRVSHLLARKAGFQMDMSLKAEEGIETFTR